MIHHAYHNDKRYLELADQMENNHLRNKAHLEELNRLWPTDEWHKWYIGYDGRPYIAPTTPDTCYMG